MWVARRVHIIFFVPSSQSSPLCWLGLTIGRLSFVIGLLIASIGMIGIIVAIWSISGATIGSRTVGVAIFALATTTVRRNARYISRQQSQARPRRCRDRISLLSYSSLVKRSSSFVNFLASNFPQCILTNVGAHGQLTFG